MYYWGIEVIVYKIVSLIALFKWLLVVFSNSHSQHQSIRNLLADLVSLNIMSSILFLSSGRRPLKSESFSGVLLSVIINFISALFADSAPKGAFSTIIASEGFRF